MQWLSNPAEKLEANSWRTWAREQRHGTVGQDSRTGQRQGNSRGSWTPGQQMEKTNHKGSKRRKESVGWAPARGGQRTLIPAVALGAAWGQLLSALQHLLQNWADDLTFSILIFSEV